ncbi:hypothetical protein QJS10_CPA09g00442 [Acorus calamus]|uniref:RIN4 pathogenic type III effector avirulence factor Avr cleavage site domain-containing protein n=1 Tax=Acorus calamus TaxID=4465 RepID=A0AAV9E3B7_ACOCL|nr:hypothetical protein QJS10_CPA09g00442 [Acorus calamus]
MDSMEARKEANGGGGAWMSVPTFGGWDAKEGFPDYSLDFSKVREMRKQNKKDVSRVSVGNEEELIPHHHKNRRSGDPNRDYDAPLHHDNHSPTARRKILSYFNCCIKA